MMIKHFYLVLFCFFSSHLLAQTDMAIGEWKLLLPYNHTVSVSHSSDKLFYASNYSVFSKDQTDGSVEYYDLVRGLSETDIRFIKYDAISKKLFIIYQNSNIDVLVDGEIENLPIIKDKQILGDKFIYDIYFDGGIAYFSCGFGVVGLNTNSLEVIFSTFTEKPVKGLSIIEEEVYASVGEGIYHINKNGNEIFDFVNWIKLTNPNLPTSFNTGFVGTQNSKLYFGMNDKLVSYQFDEEIMDTIFTGLNQHLVKMTQEDEGLLAVFKCDGPALWDDCDGKVIYIPKGNEVTDTIKIFGTPATFRPVDAVQAGGEVWLVDEWYPFRKVGLDGGYEDFYSLNGPASHRAFRTKVFDDTLYVVAGRWSPSKSFPALSVVDGLSFQNLETQQWNFVNRAKYPFLSDIHADQNYMDIAIHPVTRKKYIASFGDGILEIDGEKISVINATNSILKPEPGYDDRVGVLGLAFDKKNNLWATNYNSEKSLVVFKEDGSSQAFDVGIGNHFTNRLIVDDYGNKWMIIVSKGLLVYSTGESLNDLSDDKYKLFNTANSELVTNHINDLAKDQDGFIWAGTDEGVIVFDCGGDVFGEYCRGNLRISSLDGFNAHLLESEKINAVMIDGANRKWFGTSNGVFVLSPSGEEVIHSFTILNSPLPSNDIQSLSINNNTGTVFIGTSFGLISYQSEAILGKAIHQDVYAYPNPVRPDYSGPIAIKGLAQNATIKITDIEGRLVYETEALGGQAIWDGQDYNHEKVESGVYLVYSSAQPGLTVNAAVAKIVIIK